MKSTLMYLHCKFFVFIYCFVISFFVKFLPLLICILTKNQIVLEQLLVASVSIYSYSLTGLKVYKFKMLFFNKEVECFILIVLWSFRFNNLLVKATKLCSNCSLQKICITPLCFDDMF